MRSIRKAVAGAVGGFLAALGTAMIDGDLTRPEAIAAGGFGLLAGFGVYATPRNEARP